MTTLDKIGLWICLIAVLYFGVHMVVYWTRPMPNEIGREIVLKEIRNEWKDNNVFYVCSADGWCLKLIPRKNEASLNINVVEGRI